MRAPETLRYEEVGDVATVTLLRSHINMKVVRELTAVCDHLEDESEAGFVVFRGDGPDFSEGIDFSEFRHDQPMDIHGFNKWEKICLRIENLPKVTIAAMRGAVVGGGFQLALVCDARIAAGDAKLQLPEVHLGFLPGMATFRLAKYIGVGRAKRMMLTCPTVDAQQAVDWGIVDRLAQDLDAALAEEIAALGPNHSVAIELTRRLVNESFDTSYENAIGHFLAAQHRAISQTAFLDTLKKHRKG